MKRIIAFLKKKDLYLGIARYLLGLEMITYGLTKILRTQFVVIPFSMWQRPLELISGRMLAWAFLGYSPWFQVMLGFLELIPSLLLLFRRTALLGALLLLPMTLNVFLINHALNLWDDTKVISLILLILNIIILAFEWKRLKAMLLLIIGGGKKFKFTVVEVAINIVVAGVVFFLAGQDLWGYRNETNVLTGDWYNHRPNEWVLQSEKMNDSIVKPRLQKIYFGAYGEYSEINDTGYVARNQMWYDINEKKHQLAFYNKLNKLIGKYSYSFPVDSLLRLEKVIDSVKNTKLVQLYKRRLIHVGAD